MIDPSLFVDEMERRWLEYPMASRPRIVTPGVRQLWQDMGAIFNAQLLVRDEAHPVVAAALGSGKSTAMKVWSSLLPFDQHPGVLVVVRQIEDAERVAADINAWAGRDDMAFAYHSALDFAVKQDLSALQ